MANELGKFLERIRIERRLSLREAAEKSGLSYTYIRDIELGTNRKTKKEVIPSPATLKKLADAYSIDYYSLLEKAGIVDEQAVKDATQKISQILNEYKNDNLQKVPLVGTICAGNGIIAEENIEDYILYPLPRKTKPDFALRVKGDSMINAQIQDGDIVYFRSAKWAEYNGQIVAVIVNGEEGTLKRMYWDASSPKIKLVPENDQYETIEAYPNEIIVCGVYCGHFRPEKGDI